MVDFVSSAKRANIMRGSRSSNTKPEMRVRTLLHSLGYRYRLHDKYLPGKPDLVFLGRRKVIFVHGCFWHQHDDDSCQIVRRPSSNTAFWNAKFEQNRARDVRNLLELDRLGWDALTLWECELNGEGLANTLLHFLGPNQLTDRLQNN